MTRLGSPGREPGAAFLLLCIATISQAATPTLLPLEPGAYVAGQKTPCREAPLAAVVEFNGLALSGPHDSDCTSVLLSHHDSIYQVSTTCHSLGDGTTATSYTQAQTIRVISRTRFTRVDNGGETHYARCRSFR